MHTTTVATFILLLALASDLGAMQVLKDVPTPLSFPDVENLHDVRYLPAWRYTGTPGPFGDWEMTLNLHLPRPVPGQRRPLLMYVHGGGYSAGHKDESYPLELFRAALAKGFAVASMNYILAHRGSVPQMFWDFEEAARFLRVNAERYGLDPNAFAAVGISAGGWLITSTGHADGTVYGHEINGYIAEERLRDGAYVPRFLESGSNTFLRPVLATETAHPGVSGRWQLLVYDFAMLGDRPTSFTPSLIGMVGKNRTEVPEAFAKAGVDWTPLVLDYPPLPDRYLKGVHAPNLKESVARQPDGSFAPMCGVLVDLMREKLLGPQVRTPAPEIWPTLRRIARPVDVTLVATDPAIAVHYTLDGSEPTTASTLYAKPVTIAPGTTVKALAVMKGRAPSRGVAATFIAAPPLPRVVAPDAQALPPGETGKPYRCGFKADLPNARFTLEGDLGNEHRNNMLLADDGTFSGVPQRPGTYWLQVWVNDGRGRVATHRNYTWTVTGADLAPPGQAPQATGDTNIPIATLGKWSERNIHYLRGELRLAGIAAVLETIDGKTGETMVLVPAADKARAVAALTTIAATTGQPVAWAD